MVDQRPKESHPRSIQRLEMKTRPREGIKSLDESADSICLPPVPHKMSLSSRNPTYPNAQLFSGIVETTMDALRLVEAARQGLIPRIVRRLNSSERQNMIKSGAVFVFSVEESGIKRWTDSMLWSPSRIDGNFLVSYCTPIFRFSG